MAIEDLTITELRADTSDSDTIYIRNIGREGLFRLDSLDTTSVDDGAMTIVNSLNSRYKRVYSGEVDM